MTATLRVVLDQLTTPIDDDLASVSRDLAQALIATAPAGCEVEAIVPAGGAAAAAALPGIARVKKLALPRRELAAAWQAGIASSGGGMIHSPSLLAPLVKHDRVHDHDQTVPTVWDLRPWLAPKSLPKTTVAWHKAMLKRAIKHADAVVVPTHAHAERLADLTKLGSRIRVIPGAPPAGLAAPFDAGSRVRGLGLPAEYVLLARPAADADLEVALQAIAQSLSEHDDLEAVIIGVPEGSEPAIADLAAAAGIAEHRVHVRGDLEGADRASAMSAARVYVEASRAIVFPWRALEALVLATPVVAAASPVVAEVIADGADVVGDVELPANPDEFGAAIAKAATDDAVEKKLRVLAADRVRAFSWQSSAERVWQLHADL